MKRNYKDTYQPFSSHMRGKWYPSHHCYLLRHSSEKPSGGWWRCELFPSHGGTSSCDPHPIIRSYPAATRTRQPEDDSGAFPHVRR